MNSYIICIFVSYIICLFIYLYKYNNNFIFELFLQEYSALFEGAGNNPGDKTLEDKFFEHEVNLYLLH